MGWFDSEGKSLPPFEKRRRARLRRARAVDAPALRAAELRVLVATNVAARGLDVASLEAVVNYELPRSTADYTHRVGRTGRAGEAGLAVSFIASTGPVTLTVLYSHPNPNPPLHLALTLTQRATRRTST